MKVVVLWVVAAVFTMASSAHAAIDDSAALAYLHKSGLWARLGPELGQQIQSGMARSRRGTPTSQEERMARRVQEAYAPDRLRAVALGIVATEADAAHLETVGAWYKTPLGRRVGIAEKAAAADSRSNDDQLREGAAVVAAASAERRAVLEGVVTTAGLADCLAVIAADLVVAIRMGGICAADCSHLPSGEAVQAMRDQMLPELRKLLMPLALAAIAPMYASLSDAELGEYIAFMETPAGQHVSALGVKTLQAVFANASMQLGRAFADTRKEVGI